MSACDDAYADAVPRRDWALWEIEREDEARAYAAMRCRRVRPTRADLEAQLHALRTDRDERVVELGRRVAQLELILDQALRVHQALGRGRNDERVAT